MSGASVGQSDAWGPSLQLPRAPATPAAGSGPASSSIAGGSPPSGSSPLDPRSNSYNRPLSEDPIYLAAIEQALHTSSLGAATNSTLSQTSQQRQKAGAGRSKSSGLDLGSGSGPGCASGSKPSSRGSIPLPLPPPPAPPGSSSRSAGLPKSQSGPPAVPLSTSPAQRPVKSASAAMPIAAAVSGDKLLASGPSSRSRGATKGDGGGGGGGEQATDGKQPSAGRIGQDVQDKNQKRQDKGRASGAQQQQQCTPYLDAVELQRGIKTGRLFRGRLRANVSDRREAYVTVPGLPHDLLLRGEASQNRALEGDEVAVEVLPLSKWYTVYRLAGGNSNGNGNGSSSGGVASASGDAHPPWWCAKSAEGAKEAVSAMLEGQSGLRATARVVGILEPGAKRERLVGVLQAGTGTSGGERVLHLLPLDPRMPSCQVSPTSVKGLPAELVAEAAAKEVQTRTLMSARVVDWPVNSPSPVVELRASLGQAGEIESETAAILEMEGVRAEPFSPEVLACLPRGWSISEEDVKERRDFRSARVFSIDPPTAKDLDDALSIEPLAGGGFRVGVHIADVATFIPPYSALDYEAGLRSTSVYLVQRVIPMLPPLLCEELCSLNPGVERFAFSVVWDLDADGNIRSQWAGRSVICSCAKLAYPMVQDMIEGRFERETCPATIHGGHTWDEVVGDCLALHQIAMRMRKARFDNGALRLDNVRLTFRMDKDGNPVSAGQYVQQEANQLVEEFMLLANMSVAQIISKAFPELAMLRRHPPPNERKLKELQCVADDCSLQIDASSGASLHASLAALRAACDDSGLVDVVTLLATKPMQLAEYFCTGLVPDEEGWRHYALAVGSYTHFTSPIRRYPDVVVHRVLAAALDVQNNGLSAQEALSKHRLFQKDLCGKVAAHCNDKRLAARNAQDASLRMYLCCLLRKYPVVADSVVINVGGDKYFNVYVPEYGVECRIWVDQLGVPVMGKWQAGPKVLVLEEGSPETTHSNPGGFGGRSGGSGSNNAGSSSGRNNSSSAGSGQQALKTASSNGPQQGRTVSSSSSPLDPCSQEFSYSLWLNDLQSKGLANPHALQGVMLPLKVHMFAHFPVILTSPLRPGKISEVVARPFFAGLEVVAEPALPGAAEQRGAAAGPQAAGEPEFQIPWGAHMND